MARRQKCQIILSKVTVCMNHNKINWTLYQLATLSVYMALGWWLILSYVTPVYYYFVSSLSNNHSADLERFDML